MGSSERGSSPQTETTRPKASTSGASQRVSIVTGFSNGPNNFSSKVIYRWCARVKKVSALCAPHVRETQANDSQAISISPS